MKNQFTGKIVSSLKALGLAALCSYTAGCTDAFQAATSGQQAKSAANSTANATASGLPDASKAQKNKNPAFRNRVASKAGVQAQSLNDNQLPQNGWWWNTGYGGSGLAVEIDYETGNFLAVDFFYDQLGQPRWAMMGLSGQDHISNTGSQLVIQDRISYPSGHRIWDYSQPAPKAPALVNYLTQAPATINFSGPTTGSFGNSFNSWTGPPIQRFQFGDMFATNVIKNGWYWNTSNGGSGYFIEEQGNTVFIGLMSYDAYGQPTWYVSVMSATKTSPSYASFSGTLQTATGGSYIGGPFKANKGSDVGPISLSFSDSLNAIMTLPNGYKVAITKFSLGTNDNTCVLYGTPHCTQGNTVKASVPLIAETGDYIEVDGRQVGTSSYIWDTLKVANGTHRIAECYYQDVTTTTKNCVTTWVSDWVWVPDVQCYTTSTCDEYDDNGDCTSYSDSTTCEDNGSYVDEGSNVTTCTPDTTTTSEYTCDNDLYVNVNN